MPMIFLDVVHALPATRANHQRVTELLAPDDGQVILDVGCGAGSFARALAPRVGPTVTSARPPESR